MSYNFFDSYKAKKFDITENFYLDGTEVKNSADRMNEMMGLGTNRVHLLNYGAIPATDDDYFVKETDMQNGEYTIAEHDTLNPARPLLITVAQDAGADTMGTLDIVGKNAAGEIIEEEVEPNTNSTKETDYAYSEIISITGKDWVASGEEDQIEIGFADKMGAPIALSAETDALIYVENTTIKTWDNVSVGTPATVEESILTFDDHPDGTRKFIVMFASQTE